MARPEVAQCDVEERDAMASGGYSAGLIFKTVVPRRIAENHHVAGDTRSVMNHQEKSGWPKMPGIVVIHNE